MHILLVNAQSASGSDVKHVATKSRASYKRTTDKTYIFFIKRELYSDHASLVASFGSSFWSDCFAKCCQKDLLHLLSFRKANFGRIIFSGNEKMTYFSLIILRTFLIFQNIIHTSNLNSFLFFNPWAPPSLTAIQFFQN